MGLFGKAFNKIKDAVDGDDDKQQKEAPKPWNNDYATQGQATDAGVVTPEPSASAGSGATASGSSTTESAPSTTTATAQPSISDTAAQADAGDAPETPLGSAAAQTTAGAATQSDHGTVSGSGLDRVYVTRAGDSLEAIGAYFYGDAIQAQRLLDDNPELDLRQYGGALPGGIRIKVGEDAARGDAIPGSNS